MKERNRAEDGEVVPISNSVCLDDTRLTVDHQWLEFHSLKVFNIQDNDSKFFFFKYIDLNAGLTWKLKNI